MYHCILNYDDIIILDMFHIKISSIIFLTKSESMISWYFLSNVFEAFKECHKLRFSILINRTNLHLLFLGHQVRENTCQCL